MNQLKHSADSLPGQRILFAILFKKKQFSSQKFCLYCFFLFYSLFFLQFSLKVCTFATNKKTI